MLVINWTNKRRFVYEGGRCKAKGEAKKTWWEVIKNDMKGLDLYSKSICICLEVVDTIYYYMLNPVCLERSWDSSHDERVSNIQLINGVYVWYSIKINNMQYVIRVSFIRIYVENVSSGWIQFPPPSFN